MGTCTNFRISAARFAANPILLSCVVLSLSACGTAMKQVGEALSDEYIDFEPLYTAEFSKRGGSAIAVDKSEKALEAEQFIKLGSLSVKYVNRRCFPGEECEDETHSNQPTARLLREAADLGADAVRLQSDNSSGSGEAVKNGACLNWTTQQVPYSACNYESVCGSTGCYTRQTYCNTRYQSQTVCDKWEQIYGTEYYQRSSASVWRNDPQLIVDVRFGDLFHTAVESGDTAAASKYLGQGIRADLPDLRGRYPILTAVEAKKNAAGVTRLLLENGANPKVDNNRALDIATRRNDIELTGQLLAHGADPNDSVGVWGLLLGGEEKLIEKGGPIINASSSNNTEMVRLLLEHRADPNVDDGRPLRNAILRQNPEMMHLLLENGASVREDGVITSAVEAGQADLVAMLLERGASADNRSWDGSTPLQLASQRGNVEIMKLLLDRGASINKRGFGGAKTPLMFAVEAGQVEAVRLLIERKAGLDIDDVPTGMGVFASLAGIKGQTALTKAKFQHTYTSDPALKQRYQQIIDLLVAAGATEKP